MPRRGKKHYTEIWAEEDGAMAMDTSSRERLPPNQARGSLEQMDDDTAETDEVSAGPVLSRLLATMRVERRSNADEKDKSSLANGDASLPNGDTHEQPNEAAHDSTPPPATHFTESTQPNWKLPSNMPKPDFSTIDERLKAELRYIGFLGPDEEPEYDAHADDEVAARLRILQAELRRQIIINGARKARIAQFAQEAMAYQEFSTIRDDLDTQVQQAYLKRNRTMSKGKKHAKRPGGAGGGSHYPVGAALGVARPAGIGDQANKLMERRVRWKETIGPVFSHDVEKVRVAEDSIFKEEDMAPLYRAEREGWDEEGD
jgi:transcriptional adapter 3